MKPSLPVTATTADSVWLLPLCLETPEWYSIGNAGLPGRGGTREPAAQPLPRSRPRGLPGFVSGTLG
jgi:hypothetical protein